MLTLMAETNFLRDERGGMQRWHPGLWRLRLSASSPVIAGTTDRTGDAARLRAALASARGFVGAAQVHGASLTAVESPHAPAEPIPGCDGLTTSIAGLALLIRTADCVPLFAWDARRRVAGLAHVGWRGLAGELPIRLAAWFRTMYHSRLDHLQFGIGPAIRACCYEVGEEFEQRFAAFLRRHEGRRTCDVVAGVVHQLSLAGIRPSRISDSGVCTACHPARWCSVRRGAEPDQRLLSFILLKA